MSTFAALAEPIVSVCIPTFNRPVQLDRLLSLVRQQTYEGLDILVSDNCSPDPRVEDICRGHAKEDSRVHYIRQTKNHGMVANQMFLFNEANGTYVVTLHDDDEVPVNYIAAMVEQLERKPELSLCGPACSRFYEGKFWYDYERFDNSEMDQFGRLSDIVHRAFVNPWSFEHLIYGVFRRAALPSAFRFGRWRSIIMFFYVMSIPGAIKVLPTITMTKHTTRSDIEKYAAAQYVKRDALLRIFNDIEFESRITTLTRLLYYTGTSRLMKLATKIRMVPVVLSEFRRNPKAKAGPPLPA